MVVGNDPNDREAVENSVLSVTTSPDTLKADYYTEGKLELGGEKLVNPKEVPNAGSFFKNPIVSLSKKVELEKMFPDIKIYPFEGGYKVFAGFLIEKAGWKGKSLGPVKVSDKHALVLTNPDGNGNFSDIKKLADAITVDVSDKFGINLEPEVQYIEF